MRKNTFLFFSIVISSIILGSFFSVVNNSVINFSDPNYPEKIFDDEVNIEQDLNPKLSSGNNYDNIQSIFNSKLSQYSTLGYFKQIYTSSLQATYYSLYILDAIGKLDIINQTEICDFIITHYNESSGIFMDKYAYRYLDTDLTIAYYPYTSVLQVNCYALLSLSILNQLDLINSQFALDFIRSCYNPETSGFIGQPYSPTLDQIFKLSTMDNTYFAIITLDMLGDNWSSYSEQKDDLINFINELQSTDTAEPFFGGFYNDEDTQFNSLSVLMEYYPNLLSSYYCIRSLKIFNLESTIRTNDFHQFLNGIYHNSLNLFQMSYAVQFQNNYYDLVATALGLQLSDLTNYPIDRNGVINYLLNNRNIWGLWNASTIYNYHELIDTFQIVRALKEGNILSQLTFIEKDQIANSIESLYFQYNQGFSLLSEDYITLNLIHNIVNAFHVYNRISDLDIQDLFIKIKDSYRSYDFPTFNAKIFLGSVSMEQSVVAFRSLPIEFFSFTKKKHFEEINELYNQKTTYYALDSLKKLYKLDDFMVDHNLEEILNNIIQNQFLATGFNKSGGFLSNSMYLRFPLDLQNSNIFLENAYYAIKSLEILAEVLKLGDLTNLNFNKEALYNYLLNNLFETNTTLYFNPEYSDNVDQILKNTYYMLYMLKSLNRYAVNNEKIKQFVLESINYGNIKNLYYCYKIARLLSLDIGFDIELTSQLVDNLYSGEFKEFYQSTHFEVIDQEIFSMICDMAISDDYKVECNYSSLVYLGSVNKITVSISNIIFSNRDQGITMEFDSNQFGVLPLEKQMDSTFQLSLYIPEEKDCYPEIDGILRIYDGTKLLTEYEIILETTYDFSVEDNYFVENERIYFEYNITYGFYSGNVPALNTRIYANISQNGIFYETKNFTRKDYTDYSTFTLDYEYLDEITYEFEFYLIDEIHPNGLALKNFPDETILPPLYPEDPNSNPDPTPDNDPPSEQPKVDWLLTALIGIMIGLPLSLMSCNIYKNLINKNKREIDLSEKFGTFNHKKIPFETIQDIEDLSEYFSSDDESQMDVIDDNDSYMVYNSQYHDSKILNRRNSKYDQKIIKILDFKDSLIKFLKENRVLTLVALLGILMVIGVIYFAATLIIILMFGGIIIGFLGGFVCFVFDRKLGAKIGILGGLMVGIGYVIFLLKLTINTLI